ncbi:MAG TPA: phosphatase PAP2 family protein [Bacteroidota bacterium]|nr:phosphatase PAP2 family protein [Bacteroidota bacterium]
MIDFLYSIDVALFFFINHSLANPVFDIVMPFVTDLNRIRAGQILYVSAWLLLMIKGGRNGRVAGVMLIVGIVVSDQLSSSVLKPLVGRIRPCHVLPNVRLLVECGGGLSFPSSHAVNNFCAAAILSSFFASRRWVFFSIASLVAFTRPYVGVHYPSDIAGGAVIGAACGYLLAFLWIEIDRRWIAREGIVAE